MTRLEFKTGLGPSLAFLGALWQRFQSAVDVHDVRPHRNDAITLSFHGAEILEMALALETAIQAMSAIQLLIERHEEAHR